VTFRFFSVNHFQNFLQQQTKTKTLGDLLSRKEELEKKINLENTHIEILNEELNL